MRVVIAPDSFKGSATAAEVAAAIAEGWLAARPGDEITTIPLADGGEGTAEVIGSAYRDGIWHETQGLIGPDGRATRARWLELPDGTGVLDLAAASGLPMMSAPDPLGAQTYGLGQLIADALDHGVRRLVIGLGGSASTDGGTGALAALGARFLDASGDPLPLGGGSLRDLASIDLGGLRAAPPDGVSCLTDVSTPLAGAPSVFAPQKGATPADIALLEQGLERLASLLGGSPDTAGTGAAGGTGYGLMAAWGAMLEPGASTVAELVGLPSAIAKADLVISGEGRFDATSLAGKVVGNVLSLASTLDTPAAVIAGQLGAEAPCPAIGLADLAGSPAAAIADPIRWLRIAATHLATVVPRRASARS